MNHQLTPREADELASCFENNAKDLFRFACVVTQGDQALAEDLVQQTFEHAALDWSKLRGFESNQLRAWLRSTMYYQAISRFRRNEMARRHLGEIEARYRGPESDTDHDALTAIALERCWQIIRSMPQRQHLIAVMHWRLGMNREEISKELNIAPGTVAAQLHNARKKLMAGVGDFNPFSNDDMEPKIPHSSEVVNNS